MEKSWNVYAKPVLGHAEQVLGYLGRYTHRIAIDESRLIAIHDERVQFRYRDYRQDGQRREMWLAGTEFLRRYLRHVVSRGFHRVRHYGFLANRCRRHNLQRIQALLPTRRRDRMLTERPRIYRPCPACGAPLLQAERRPPEALNTS